MDRAAFQWENGELTLVKVGMEFGQPTDLGMLTPFHAGPLLLPVSFQLSLPDFFSINLQPKFYPFGTLP